MGHIWNRIRALFSKPAQPQLLLTGSVQESWRHAILNMTGESAWLVDQRGCLLDLNASACALFGLTRQTCLGLPLDQCAALADPAIQESLRTWFAQDALVLQSGRSYRGEVTFSASSGLMRTFDINRTPVCDPSGQIIGVTSIAREITAIRIHQTELKRVHARTQSILNSVQEGILVCDRFGLTTFVNPAVTTLLGWEQAELLGNYQHDVVHHHYADGRPYPRSACPVTASLADGQSRVVEDEVFWHKDGHPVPVDYTCAPVIEDQRVSGIALVFRDVSHRRQAAEELSRLRRAIEHCPVSILITDHQGIIQFVNPAFTQITGYQQEEVIGQTPRQLKSGYHNADFYRTLWSTITQGKSWEGEMCNRKKDGTLYWEMARIAPVLNNDGRIINYVAVKEDISQRYALQDALQRQAAQLAQSNADLEQFAYAVSHDLQEPLRMVTSYMQLLKRRYVGQLDQDAHEFIDFAVDAGQRLSRMIGDLLAFSRVQTRAGNLHPVNMDDVLIAAQTNLLAAIQESQAVLHLDPLPTIMGDAAQLISLFQNLLGNALKYRALGTIPRIRVGALRDGDFWHFTVTDNGIGIAPEHTERIFGVFQRLHGRDSYEGTGIGLALCKRVAERHGGRIWVESTVGEGSVFHITLPLPAADQAGAAM